ncbi:MAG: MarR family transcriptional regulator [Pseudomonadota bacterium]
MVEDDFLQQLGISALGSRLRRLFEALNVSVSDAYRTELGFEQRWFALTRLLEKHADISVQQAADALGTSHVAVTQVVKAMETRGLLERCKSHDDARVVLLSLTEEGKQVADAVKQISRRVDQAAMALLDEAAPGFLDNLTNLENALRDTPFKDRLGAVSLTYMKDRSHA